jgi:SSS family solute:Na+ symporter
VTWIDWLIVLILNGSVMLYGLVIARGSKTSEDWFLGRRSLVWWAIGLSMFATNVDNADLVSLTGTTYKEGLHIIMVHTLGSLLGASFAAFFLVPAMARAGQFTNAEYLEARFGPSARVLSALIQIQYRSSMLGLMIWSLYLLLTGLLALESSVAWTLIIGLVTFAAAYTSLGGLKSVVMTDALQGIIMFVAMAVILSAVWNAAGGWSQMRETLETIRIEQAQPASDLMYMGRYRGDNDQTSPVVVAIGWIIIACGYWSVNHTQTMRLGGARSLWDMKMAALFGATISMPIMVGCASIGLFGRALFPEFESPDQLYPHMADLYLGVGLKGVVIAGIMAAAISTFDSMGSSLSALFTRDIYARLIVTDRDDPHYVKVSRWATVVILGLGFAYLPFIGSKETMLQAFLTLIPVFVTPLFTIYLIGIFTRAHAKAGIAGIIAGASYGVIALLDREVADVSWLAAWFTDRWPALLWAMAFTTAGAFFATLVFGKCAAENLSINRQGAATAQCDWLTSSSRSLQPIPDHPFARPPSRWCSPEILACVLIALTSFVLFTSFW